MNKHVLSFLPLLFTAGQIRAQDLPSQVRTHESRIEKLERLIGEQQRQIESLKRQAPPPAPFLDLAAPRARRDPQESAASRDRKELAARRDRKDCRGQRVR